MSEFCEVRSNMHWHLALGGKKSGMPNEGWAAGSQGQNHD